MVAEKKEVEIIPWEHGFVENHDELIKYLESIPKGSNVAIELAAIQIENIRYAMQHLTQDRKLNNQEKAVLDVVNLCDARNLTLIPLSTVNEVNALEKAKKFRQPIDQIDAEFGLVRRLAQINRIRETRFANRLSIYLKQNPKVNKLYFLCGATHSTPVERQLKSTGIAAKIKDDFYSDPIYMRRAASLQTKVNDELIKQDPDYFHLRYDMGRLTELGLRSMFTNVSSNRNVKEILAKRITSKNERVTRKLDLKRKPQRPTLRA